jgi:hypothetical protein
MWRIPLNKFEPWHQKQITTLRNAVCVTTLRLKFSVSCGTRAALMAKGHEEKLMFSIRSYIAQAAAARPGSRPSEWRCTCVVGFAEQMKNPGQLGLRRPE